MTVIDSLYHYFNDCELLQDGKLNVNFLPPEDREYTIDVVPAAQVVKRYINGSCVKQYIFVIGSRAFYSPDVNEGLASCGFYEELAAWMEEQSKRGNLPVMEDGQLARKVEAKSTGYLYANEADTARYQIQCRLEYYEEVKNYG